MARIPKDCRIARSVKLACELYDKGTDFKDARNAIVKNSEDLGWFQAPANIGFVILGLLYGEGDFSRSICLANNCGDDTDCTAATVGALLGIINGRSGIPQKWMEPIGENIKTVAINPFGLDVPKTLGELTDRVIALAFENQHENPTLPKIDSRATKITEEHIANLHSSNAVEKRVWSQSPYELVFDLPFAEVSIDYENGPSMLPGEEKRIKLSVKNIRFTERNMEFSFDLPEGWGMKPGNCASLNCVRGRISEIEFSIQAGAFAAPFLYIPLQVRLQDRSNHFPLSVPFQLKGSVGDYPSKTAQPHWDKRNRIVARRSNTTGS